MGAPTHVLILAGRRGGIDPVADCAGVGHKALAPVAGMPMLARVAATLRQALPDTPQIVAIDSDPQIDALIRSIGNLTVLPPKNSPAATVTEALRRYGTPLLIATGDHPLLTSAMVCHFLANVPADADGAAAVAERKTIEDKYASHRTYWRFAGTQVSGCNLFYLGKKAEAAVAFWRQLETDRKHPAKVLRRLGAGTVLRFVCGCLTLPQALERLGRKTGARFDVVDMPFAEAAIDVDHPEDLVLAEKILRERTQGQDPQKAGQP